MHDAKPNKLNMREFDWEAMHTKTEEKKRSRTSKCYGSIKETNHICAKKHLNLLVRSTCCKLIIRIIPNGTCEPWQPSPRLMHLLFVGIGLAHRAGRLRFLDLFSLDFAATR